MALTTDEWEKILAAELEELSFKLMRAIDESDATTFDTVSDKLDAFASDISVPLGLRYKARNILEDGALDLTAAGIAQMSAIVDDLVQAGSGLRAAIRVAETGKEEFFFPSVAAAAQRALTIFQAFQKSADQLQKAGKNIGDIGGALATAKDALDNLQAAIDSARP